MKTNRGFKITATIIAIVIVGIIIIVHESNGKTNKVMSKTEDEIIDTYLKGEVETPEIKDHVAKNCELMITETNNAEMRHIEALEKAVGVDSTARLLLSTADPYIITMCVEKGSDSLKVHLTTLAEKGQPPEAAFWLFGLLPKVALERIKNGYYPDNEDIIEELPRYYDFAMGRKTLEAVLDVIPDSVASKHLEIFDEYLMKNDVKRVLRIYAVMSAYDFCSYYEAEKLIASLKIGKPILLKVRLPKANASELNQLYGAGVIDQKNYLDKMALRPQKEVLSAYDDDIYDNKLYDRLIENVKTQEDKDALYAFFTEHKMTESIDVLLAVKK
jgi:hypothetical protein